MRALAERNAFWALAALISERAETSTPNALSPQPPPPPPSRNMARRAAPPGAGPAYYSGAPTRGRLPDPDESRLSAFFREEIFAPEKLPGNLNILTGVVVFFGGIAAIRTWGELIIPA